MRTTFGSEFMAAAKDAPRLFFAPLAGAVRAVKAEFMRVQQESQNAKPVTSPRSAKR